MVAQLKEQRERTSLGPQALLKGRDDIPEGLNHAAVTHWLGGRVKSVEKAHLAYVLKLWFAAPTNSSISIDDSLYEALSEGFRQSGLTPDMIIRWHKDRPPDLTLSKIKSILSGKTRTARAEHVSFLQKVFGLTLDD